MSLIVNEGITYERLDSARCPCCGRGLHVSMTGIPTEANPVLVYCAHGECRSLAANQPTAGMSVEQAIARMEVAVDLERLDEDAQRLKEENGIELSDDLMLSLSNWQWTYHQGVNS